MNWLDAEQIVLNFARSLTGLGVNWLVQSTLLLAFGLAAARLLRSHGSAVQSVVYRATLAAVLACPLATAGLSLVGASGWSLDMPDAFSYAKVDVAPPVNEANEATQAPATTNFEASDATLANPLALEAPTFPAQASPMAAGAALGAFPAADLNADAGALDESTAARQVASSGVVAGEIWLFAIHGFGLLAAALAIAWVVVASYLLVRLAFAWRQLERIRQQGLKAEAGTMKLCRELAGRLRVCPPDVMHSPYVPSPCLSGLRQPAVMLPDSDPGLPLRDVLIHELAHLRRRDCHWNLLRRAGTAVFWFQPLLWKLSILLEATAEEVCDDYVVQFGCDRPTYAHRLVDIAELSSAPFAAAGVGMVSLRSMLGRRVARIMDTSRSLSTRAGGAVLVLVLVGGVLGTLAAGLVGLSGSASAEATTGASTEAGQEPASPNADNDANGTLGSEQQHVAGTVLDPAGKPLKGAKVAAIRIRTEYIGGLAHVSHEALAETDSDADGKFDLSFTSDVKDKGDDEQHSVSWQIVAWSPGYGPAWKRDVHLKNDKSPTLRLAQDQPIHGRLVDLEGSPIAGAEVRVQELRPATGTPDVDKWIKESREREIPADITAYFAGATNDRYPNWFPNRWDDGGIAFGSPAMPRGTRTDADGRFEIAGLGVDRLAMVLIESPAIAKLMAPVVTRPMDTLQARPAQSDGVRTGTYYGANFEAVGEPTQAITGKVTDAETGKPLANHVVTLEAYAGYILSQNNFLTTRTDAQGNYRLVGAPAGGGHRLGVNLEVDQPYFSTSKTVERASGFEPIECDFPLRRGRWIVGKLTEGDGRPVINAAVEFLPLRDNKFATSYANYDPQITAAAPSNRFHVSKDGSYRVLAIPGAGVLTAVAEGDDKAEFMPVNPADFDARSVHENGYTNTYDPWTVTGMNALREVSIKEADDEATYDLQFTRGLSRVLKLVDGEGRPVTGASVLGRVAPPNLEEDLKKSTVKVIGLRPGDDRTVVVMHGGRRLGAALKVAPGDELTVELKPCGVARGRVLDVAGEPHSGLDVNVSVNHPDNWSRQLLGGKTGKDGRFEVLLPPGIVSRVSRYSMGGPNFSAQVEAQPGDVYELGDLADGAELKTADTAKLKATPNATSLSAAAEEDPDAAKANSAAEPIRGQVTSADGKPVIGAKLYWGTWTLRGIKTPAALAATTDARGNFEFTPPDANPATPDSPEQILNRMLVVVAPGHGMVVTNQIPAPVRTPLAAIARAIGADGNSIKLARDASIKGRIVNVEGEPVVDARVSVHRFDDGTQKGNSTWRAQQLTAKGETKHIELQAQAFDLVSQFVTPQLAAVAPSATTDADGRFELAGIGADRMVELLVQRDGVETKLVLARTTPGEKIDIKADGNFVLEDQKLYGPEFTLVAGPSKPVEGRVLDVDTGEPLVGAVVRTYAVHGERLSSSRNRQHFATVTDKGGRYRIVGLPLGADNKIVAFTVGDEPYVPLGAVADTSKGESPLTIDFRLKHGAWAEGRAYDANTKAPLAGEISYFILRDPKIEKAMPGLRHAFVDELYFAGADGKFRVPIFPTRGVIGFRHTSTNGMTNYPRGAGADAIGMTEDIGVPAIATMTHYIMADSFNALAAVEPKEGERTVKVEIALSAGSRLTVHPIDEEGQPLSGLEFYGRTEYYSWENGHGPVCEVQGLMPGESRKIVFYDRRRDLAGAAVVDASTKDGLKVTLTPAARLRGRLVNEDGEPLTDVSLYPHLEEVRSDDKAAIWPDDPKLHYNPSIMPMDKDGRFQIVGLIPGWKYTGNVLGKKKMNGAMMQYGFGSAFNDVTLNPGEDRDLGDLVVKTN